jgi:hypothetical protein
MAFFRSICIQGGAHAVCRARLFLFTSYHAQQQQQADAVPEDLPAQLIEQVCCYEAADVMRAIASHVCHQAVVT